MTKKSSGTVPTQLPLTFNSRPSNISTANSSKERVTSSVICFAKKADEKRDEKHKTIIKRAISFSRQFDS